MCSGESQAAHIRGPKWALWVLSVFPHTILWAQTPTIEPAADPIPIQVGQTLRATQRAEEPVTYVFDAVEGETYLIEVTQDGLDFVVTAQAPDDGTQSYDSPLRRDEPEYVLLDQTSTGSYRITIVSDELTHAQGSHSIGVTRLATIGAENVLRLEAWRLIAAGAAVNADANEARLDETTEEAHVRSLKETSRAAYGDALGLWQELGDPRMQAHAQYSMAMIAYWDLYDWARSAEMAESAAKIYQELNEQSLYARTRFAHAYALVEMAGELETETADATFDTALRLFEEVYEIDEQLGNLYELAEVMNFVGYTHHLRGDFVEAVFAWNRSASMFASIGEWREELNVQQNLAVIDLDEGYVGNAINKLQYIVDQIPEGADVDLEAIVLDNLGAAHRDYGNIDEALRSYSHALALQENASHVATSLRGLGSTYYVAGELDRARNYLHQALTAARSTGDRRNVAGILTYLGNIHYLEADYLAALEQHQEAVRQTNSKQDRVFRQVLVAKDLAALGRHPEAIALATDLIASSVESPLMLADAHLQLGRSSISAGNHRAAVDHLQEALGVYESLGLQEGEADALNGLALAARRSGRRAEAVVYGEASLERIESLRARLSAPELRAFYSASRRKYYETQIDVLMTSGGGRTESHGEHLLAALSTSERARARMMVDLLAEASIDLDGSLNEELVSRRSELYEELAARRYQRDRLLKGGVSLPNQLDTLLNEMVALENELTLLETGLRSDNSESSGSSSSQVLTAAEIQRSIDSGSVLLQYALGDERSFVWVVTRDSVQGIELPDRGTIEAAARRAFESLESYGPDPSSRRRLNDDLAELSRFVLAPVVELLEADRVLVAADGALHYIPFPVLPVEVNGVSEPLIAAREVVSVPSMSVLAAQRVRSGRKPPSKTLAVFADPVLERTDQRLLRPDYAEVRLRSDVADLATRSSVGGQLGRLVATGDEAASISALVSEDSRLVAVGFDANRSTLLGTDLSQYRFLHFATHGLVDSRYPALSSLALSQFDHTGNSQNGFLRLHDIYNLKLNANLVVLSACETALGRQIRGEGLIGLSQGFMYAGARSLVVSLWQVPDRATAELMVRFYEYLLDQRLPPAQALRQAQISIATQPRWSDPYFWGAFVFLGDWEPPDVGR